MCVKKKKRYRPFFIDEDFLFMGLVPLWNRWLIISRLLSVIHLSLYYYYFLYLNTMNSSLNSLITHGTLVICQQCAGMLMIFLSFIALGVYLSKFTKRRIQKEKASPPLQAGNVSPHVLGKGWSWNEIINGCFMIRLTTHWRLPVHAELTSVGSFVNTSLNLAISLLNLLDAAVMNSAS